MTGFATELRSHTHKDRIVTKVLGSIGVRKSETNLLLGRACSDLVPGGLTVEQSTTGAIGSDRHTKDIPVHICRGCCKDEADSKSKLERTARQLLFRRRPTVLAINKWSKLALVIDFVMPLVVCHSLLGKCMQTLRTPPQAGQEEPDAKADDLDEGLKSDKNFAKRFQSSLDFLVAEDTPERLLFLALCLEPLRAGTAWWMRRARASDFHGRSYLLDAVYAPFSPVIFVLQYVSTMLCGLNERLVLVWKPFALSYDLFCKAKPGSVRIFRCMLLTVAAGVFRRHWCVFRDVSCSISRLCDKRVLEAQRRGVAALYDSTPACCMAGGSIRLLRERGISGRELFESSGLHEFLHWRAYMVPQSVCDVEWKHGQGRRAASDGGDTRISTFCIDYINRDVRLLHRARTRTHVGVVRSLEEHAGRHGPQPQNPGQTGGQPEPTRLRASMAVQIFGWDRLAAVRRSGEKVNPASRAWHERVRGEWSELQPDIQAWYFERAQQSKVEAVAAWAAKRARHDEVAGIVRSEGDGEEGGHQLVQQLPDNSPGHRAFPHSVVVGVDAAQVNEPPRRSSLVDSVARPPPETALQPEAVAAFLEGSSVKAEFRRFAKTASQLPTVAPDTLAEKAKHVRACRGICFAAIPQPIRAFSAKLRMAMANLGGSEGYGAASARADLLIVVEVFANDGGDAQAATCFAHLCLATGRHAQLEAEQTFAMMQVIFAHESPFDYGAKILLEYVFQDFVEPGKVFKPPLNRQSVGIPHLLTEADFAAHILCNMIPGGGGKDQTLVKRVIFRQLLFEDLSFDAVADAWDARPVGGGACDSMSRERRSGPASPSARLSLIARLADGSHLAVGSELITLIPWRGRGTSRPSGPSERCKLHVGRAR